MKTVVTEVKEATRTYGVRLPDAMMQDLMAIARRVRISRNKLIEVVLSRYIDAEALRIAEQRRRIASEPPSGTKPLSALHQEQDAQTRRIGDMDGERLTPSHALDSLLELPDVRL